MHGIKTLDRINREAAEAAAIVEKHNGVTHVPQEKARDYLIGYHYDVAIITPLTTKAVQWAFANIKKHLGREGIAYVVEKNEGVLLEMAIVNQGFKVN